MANILFLRLEGPLQSWGERSRWDYRDTAAEPTKSGVVGLLGCCLGIATDEPLRFLSRNIRLGIRCDKPGTLLTDYHTISGGILSAEGKIRTSNVISHRQYLCDASFLAAILSEDPSLIEHLSDAVQAPYWPPFLGRKSCPPSKPIYAGVGQYSSLEEALRDYDSTGLESVRVVIECKPNQGIRRLDEIDSRSLRTFLPRYRREFLMTYPTQSKKEAG